MEHPFSAKLTYVAKKGQWPALRGELYENIKGVGNVLIGTFSRGPVVDNWIPPIEYKFRSEAAFNRFDDFANCLSIEDTIDALI